MSNAISLLVKLLISILAFIGLGAVLIRVWKDYDERRMMRNYGVTYSELINKYRKN